MRPLAVERAREILAMIEPALVANEHVMGWATHDDGVDGVITLTIDYDDERSASVAIVGINQDYNLLGAPDPWNDLPT